MPPREGRHFLLFGSIAFGKCSAWNPKITFCPHFVRFCGGFGGYRSHTAYIGHRGYWPNEEDILRGRVRARGAWFVVEYLGRRRRGNGERLRGASAGFGHNRYRAH